MWNNDTLSFYKVPKRRSEKDATLNFFGKTKNVDRWRMVKRIQCCSQ